MTQVVSIKNTRDKLAEIIDQVAIGGSVFVITKFGKPKAMIVPFSQQKADSSGIEESFGAWKSRKDMQDSNAWVKNLRAKMSARNE